MKATIPIELWSQQWEDYCYQRWLWLRSPQRRWVYSVLAVAQEGREISTALRWLISLAPVPPSRRGNVL